MAVISHTPSWLSAPSRGFDLFQPGPNTKTPATLMHGGKKMEYRGPVRTIAHRGTEVFVVVGNDIRWSDLVALKDAPEDAPEGSYRVLKTPVAGQIRQLIISPHGDYLAILTSHTVHIAILPDSSHLSVSDSSPLRIKTFQLGPTAHVLEQAPIISALWHPLGHMGSCLVTITTDACVRLWELNRDSRASFDEPSLALDLKKLGNATSSDQDFGASKYGTSKGFSPDSVEMEVAAACFGGKASSEEHGWSSMTLWVAMTQGDVYSLCPLLPSKWEPTSTTIPSLSTAVVSKSFALSQIDSSQEEIRLVDQQKRWLADIDSQDPLVVSHVDTLATFEVYNRPSNPPAIPKLQGPFYLNPEADLDEISDIFVIAPRIDDDALMEKEDQDDFLGHEGLSVGIVCLATCSGKIHICLDLDGVEAQWLPSKFTAFRRRLDVEESISELLLIETLTTSETTTSWPTFTPNSTSRYSFFLSSNEGLFSISLDPWITPLEDEFINPSDSGTGFRLDVLFNVEQSIIEQILTRDLSKTITDKTIAPSCISIIDADLSHFILTFTSSQPQAVILDLPVQKSVYTSFAPDDVPLALPAPPPRQPYQPSPAFFTTSTLSGFLDSATQSNKLKRSDFKDQIRFSSATLQLLTDAHRLLSTETSRLGAAAADLFRRCERMRAELSEQIRKVDEISKRSEAITGDDDQNLDQPRLVGKERIDQRMDQARNRSKELTRRVEIMRRKMAGLGGRELSLKEEAWVEEVATLSNSLESDGQDMTGFVNRLETVNQLQLQLVAQAKEITNQRTIQGKEDLTSSSSLVPADFKKEKIHQVMQLLERETALVDAVMDRLGRLKGV